VEKNGVIYGIERLYTYRKQILVIFGIFAALSIASLPFLLFSFSFEQFFPQGDEDLVFFEEFIEDFGTDDNFLLIAIENEPSVFESSFLQKVDRFVDKCQEAEHVDNIQSLTKLKLPIKTDEGFIAPIVLDPNNDDLLEESRDKILNDERFLYNLINKEGTALCVFIRTSDQIGMKESEELMSVIHAAASEFDSEKIHYLGRPYFQDELSRMQKREVIMSTSFGALLVGFILAFLFRRWAPVLIAYVSIGLGLLLFFGVLSLLQRELNAIAAFYPVLMLIVGTSDIVHIMSKYIDEAGKGKSEKEAILITVKEIGLATLMTSLTTSIGFLSLMTSKLQPIQDFGINSAMGVIIAYICTIFFSCSLISLIPKEKFLRNSDKEDIWAKYLDRLRLFTLRNPKGISIGLGIFLVLSVVGISKISTNYDIASNLPRGEKITKDFHYFEKNFAGFRPYEFVVTLQDGVEIDDYETIRNLDLFENYLKELNFTNAVSSIASLYKSMNYMAKGNLEGSYSIPPKDEFVQLKALSRMMPMDLFSSLISKDGRKTRVSSRIQDLGADRIKEISTDIDLWIVNNMNPKIFEIRRTGTGLIIDKNSEYVRNNLIQGLGMALVIISFLMGFLFKNIRMLFISLIPNVLPLILAAMIIGFFHIELEAVISIVFALIFGIAVDDTIHFLSKFKQEFDRTGDKEEAMKITFLETGKAICYTTIILFFGFLIMLFSVHPPSIIIGVLISITLIGAVIADLLILPMFIRKFL